MIECLVGMVGSGKSTYARKRADQGALVVSHDDLTRMLHGGRGRYEPGLRQCYRDMLGHVVVSGFAAGRDVIVDRTHLTRESRQYWVDLGRFLKIACVAVAFPIYDAEMHATRRYSADPRDRTFAKWLEVAEHHAAQAALEPLGADEGFARILDVSWDGSDENNMRVYERVPTAITERVT
jgi:predicted kinase